MGKIKSLGFEEREKFRSRPLPCLYRYNSINSETAKVAPIKTLAMKRKEANEKAKAEQLNKFTTSYAKSAYSLELNVKSFIDHFGINNVGFLTLTFADHVTDPKEAQRRFNSLRTNYLKARFPHYIRVFERTKNNRIHYHLIVATKQDIRTGLDFAEIKKRNYKSANLNIRTLWQSLRENLPNYGFGRAELLPVKTNSKGLARYISKYIGKHIENRNLQDKGFRLCQTSLDKKRYWKNANTNFQFISHGSSQWRRKLSNWVNKVNEWVAVRRPHVGLITPDNFTTQLIRLFGSKWAFLNRKSILAS